VREEEGREKWATGGNGPRRGLGRSGEKEGEDEDGSAACLGQDEEKWAAAEMGKREGFGFGVFFIYFFQTFSNLNTFQNLNTTDLFQNILKTFKTSLHQT
jgi:hypothetical protein